jgi:hypothetical protein
MYLLFLDESGTPADDLFALGGVAIKASDWPLVRARWNDCLEAAEWPSDRELKWSGTASGEVPPDTADAVYSCLAGLPVVCFATILYPHFDGYDEFFGTDEHTYATALTFIAERYQRFLSNKDEYGVIVLDSRRPDMDEPVRRFFRRIQQEGTQFAELDRIVDGLLLGPSHHSLGLQLADLVVGCTRAATFALGDNTRWFRQLEAVFARHPSSGQISGVGVKYFPDSVKPDQRPGNRLFDPKDDATTSAAAHQPEPGP